MQSYNIQPFLTIFNHTVSVAVVFVVLVGSTLPCDAMTCE